MGIGNFKWITITKLLHSFLEGWLFKVLEIIAFLLLLTKFIPQKKQDAWGESGFGLLVLISIALAYLLIINVLQSFVHKRYLKDLKLSYEKTTNENQTRINELEKLSKYAQAHIDMNEAFNLLDNHLRTDNRTMQDYFSVFQNFVTKVSSTFNDLTGEKCHVCLKLVVTKGNNRSNKSKGNKSNTNKLCARTLIRDVLTNNRNEIDKNDSISHLFEQNSSYQWIFENIGSEEGKYYAQNNLVELQEYKNTSFLPFNTLPIPKESSIEEKRKNWKLPYKSTIVVPICPGIGVERTTDKLAGFLTIDSPKEDAFNLKYDPYIIMGCADALYVHLKNYIELSKYEVEKNQNKKTSPKPRPNEIH